MNNTLTRRYITGDQWAPIVQSNKINNCSKFKDLAVELQARERVAQLVSFVPDLADHGHGSAAEDLRAQRSTSDGHGAQQILHVRPTIMQFRIGPGKGNRKGKINKQIKSKSAATYVGVTERDVLVT